MTIVPQSCLALCLVFFQQSNRLIAQQRLLSKSYLGTCVSSLCVISARLQRHCLNAQYKSCVEGCLGALLRW